MDTPVTVGLATTVAAGPNLLGDQRQIADDIQRVLNWPLALAMQDGDVSLRS